jgi:hypothetical protein
MKYAPLLFAACLTFGSSNEAVAQTILPPLFAATVTDEDGDGIPEAVGVGFGHPDPPQYGTTIVQKSNYERRAVEEFDLTGFTAFQSAVLTFTFYNSNSTPTTIATFFGAGDGLIALSDFSGASTDLGSRTIPGNQAPTISYDVTAILNSLLVDGGTYASFRQQISSATGGSAVYDPQLLVTAAVPEPKTALLCMLGLSALCFSRRRSQVIPSPR